jgi:phage terminase large subunit
VLITGQDLTNLKAGALKTFQKYIVNDFKPWVKQFNQTELVYKFKNGSTIKFDSFANEADARGNENDIVYMNECNGQSYALFWQLNRKCRRKTILDYNPASRFWVHDKLFETSPNFEQQFKGKVVRYIFNHWHNPFLTHDEHMNYELISDHDLYKVYSLGLTGKIKGLVYTATQCDAIPDDCDAIIWGCDYGYTNDPTAILKIGIRGRDAFMQECMYEPCADPDMIFACLKANGWNSKQMVYCEHDTIINTGLSLKGVPITLAKKGGKVAGSVEVSAIAKVKMFNLYYTGENFKKEVESYRWATHTSLTTGETVTINKPVDGNDHLMDAMIYAISGYCLMYGK